MAIGDARNTMLETVKATTTWASAVLEPDRRYVVQHNGIDESGVSVTDQIFLATGASEPSVVDFGAASNRFVLLESSSTIIGPGVATLWYCTQSGTAMMSIASMARHAGNF